MRLLNYDFYDIYAFITYLRNLPEKTEYACAAEDILRYIDTPGTNGADVNNVRKLLRAYIDREEERLAWVFVDNAYTANVRIVKDEARYSVLKAVLREILAVRNDSEKLRQVCDASHNIPILLADEASPKKAIASAAAEYEKNFLREELKKL